jgi:hypothetical protein
VESAGVQVFAEEDGALLAEGLTGSEGSLTLVLEGQEAEALETVYVTVEGLHYTEWAETINVDPVTSVDVTLDPVMATFALSLQNADEAPVEGMTGQLFYDALLLIESETDASGQTLLSYTLAGTDAPEAPELIVQVPESELYEAASTSLLHAPGDPTEVSLTLPDKTVLTLAEGIFLTETGAPLDGTAQLRTDDQIWVSEALDEQGGFSLSFGTAAREAPETITLELQRFEEQLFEQALEVGAEALLGERIIEPQFSYPYSSTIESSHTNAGIEDAQILAEWEDGELALNSNSNGESFGSIETYEQNPNVSLSIAADHHSDYSENILANNADNISITMDATQYSVNANLQGDEGSVPEGLESAVKYAGETLANTQSSQSGSIDMTYFLAGTSAPTQNAQMNLEITGDELFEGETVDYTASQNSPNNNLGNIILNEIPQVLDYTVTGSVTNTVAEELEGMQVSLLDDGEELASANTGPNGGYTLNHSDTDDSFTIRVSSPEEIYQTYNENIILDEGVNERNITLEDVMKSITRTGQVSGDDGSMLDATLTNELGTFNATEGDYTITGEIPARRSGELTDLSVANEGYETLETQMPLENGTENYVLDEISQTVELTLNAYNLRGQQPNEINDLVIYTKVDGETKSHPVENGTVNIKLNSTDDNIKMWHNFANGEYNDMFILLDNDIPWHGTDERPDASYNNDLTLDWSEGMEFDTLTVSNEKLNDFVNSSEMQAYFMPQEIYHGNENLGDNGMLNMNTYETAGFLFNRPLNADTHLWWRNTTNEVTGEDVNKIDFLMYTKHQDTGQEVDPEKVAEHNQVAQYIVDNLTLDNGRKLIDAEFHESDWWPGQGPPTEDNTGYDILYEAFVERSDYNNLATSGEYDVSNPVNAVSVTGEDGGYRLYTSRSKFPRGQRAPFIQLEEIFEQLTNTSNRHVLPGANSAAYIYGGDRDLNEFGLNLLAAKGLLARGTGLNEIETNRPANNAYETGINNVTSILENENERIEMDYEMRNIFKSN